MPENTPVEIGISCLSNMLFPANFGGMTQDMSFLAMSSFVLSRIGVRVSRLVPNLEIFLYYAHFRIFRLPVDAYMSTELKHGIKS